MNKTGIGLVVGCIVVTTMGLVFGFTNCGKPNSRPLASTSNNTVQVSGVLDKITSQSLNQSTNPTVTTVVYTDDGKVQCIVGKTRKLKKLNSGTYVHITGKPNGNCIHVDEIQANKGSSSGIASLTGEPFTGTPSGYQFKCKNKYRKIPDTFIKEETEWFSTDYCGDNRQTCAFDVCVSTVYTRMFETWVNFEAPFDQGSYQLISRNELGEETETPKVDLPCALVGQSYGEDICTRRPGEPTGASVGEIDQGVCVWELCSKKANTPSNNCIKLKNNYPDLEVESNWKNLDSADRFTANCISQNEQPTMRAAGQLCDAGIVSVGYGVGAALRKSRRPQDVEIFSIQVRPYTCPRNPPVLDVPVWTCAVGPSGFCPTMTIRYSGGDGCVGQPTKLKIANQVVHQGYGPQSFAARLTALRTQGVPVSIHCGNETNHLALESVYVTVSSATQAYYTSCSWVARKPDSNVVASGNSPVARTNFNQTSLDTRFNECKSFAQDVSTAACLDANNAGLRITTEYKLKYGTTADNLNREMTVDNGDGNGTLDYATNVCPSASGSISAHPSACTLGANGYCSTTVTWSGNNISVWTLLASGQRELFDARGGNQSKVYDRVTSQGVTFEIHQGNSATGQILGTASVAGVQPNCSSRTPANKYRSPASGNSCTSGFTFDSSIGCCKVNCAARGRGAIDTQPFNSENCPAGYYLSNGCCLPQGEQNCSDRGSKYRNPGAGNSCDSGYRFDSGIRCCKLDCPMSNNSYLNPSPYDSTTCPANYSFGYGCCVPNQNNCQARPYGEKYRNPGVSNSCPPGFSYDSGTGCCRVNCPDPLRSTNPFDSTKCPTGYSHALGCCAKNAAPTTPTNCKEGKRHPSKFENPTSGTNCPSGFKHNSSTGCCELVCSGQGLVPTNPVDSTSCPSGYDQGYGCCVPRRTDCQRNRAYPGKFENPGPGNSCSRGFQYDSNERCCVVDCSSVGRSTNPLDSRSCPSGYIEGYGCCVRN